MSYVATALVSTTFASPSNNNVPTDNVANKDGASTFLDICIPVVPKDNAKGLNADRLTVAFKC